MNCGQVAASTGDLLRMPDMARLQARKRRYQRMVARRRKGSKRRNLARHRLARTQRRIATIRHRWHHETSRTLAVQPRLSPTNRQHVYRRRAA